MNLTQKLQANDFNAFDLGNSFPSGSIIKFSKDEWVEINFNSFRVISQNKVIRTQKISFGEILARLNYLKDNFTGEEFLREVLEKFEEKDSSFSQKKKGTRRIMNENEKKEKLSFYVTLNVDDDPTPIDLKTFRKLSQSLGFKNETQVLEIIGAKLADSIKGCTFLSLDKTTQIMVGEQQKQVEVLFEIVGTENLPEEIYSTSNFGNDVIFNVSTNMWEDENESESSDLLG